MQTSYQQIWESMFNRLRILSESQSNSLTFIEPEDDPGLKAWIKEQRRQYKIYKEVAGISPEGDGSEKQADNEYNDELSSDLNAGRICALEQIGFTWDTRHDIQWKNLYDELCEYKERNGSCMVPSRCRKHQKLGRWVMTQRRQYVLLSDGLKSMVTKERVKMLNSIGFVWLVCNKNESRNMKELKQFKFRHGHCNVPRHYPKSKTLAKWVNSLRNRYKRAREGKHGVPLPVELVQALDGVGFVWHLGPSTPNPELLVSASSLSVSETAHNHHGETHGAVQHRHSNVRPYDSDLNLLSAMASMRSAPDLNFHHMPDESTTFSTNPNMATKENRRVRRNENLQLNVTTISPTLCTRQQQQKQQQQSSLHHHQQARMNEHIIRSFCTQQQQTQEQLQTEQLQSLLRQQEQGRQWNPIVIPQYAIMIDSIAAMPGMPTPLFVYVPPPAMYVRTPLGLPPSNPYNSTSSTNGAGPNYVFSHPWWF